MKSVLLSRYLATSPGRGPQLCEVLTGSAASGALGLTITHLLNSPESLLSYHNALFCSIQSCTLPTYNIQPASPPAAPNRPRHGYLGTPCSCFHATPRHAPLSRSENFPPISTPRPAWHGKGTGAAELTAPSHRVQSGACWGTRSEGALNRSSSRLLGPRRVQYSTRTTVQGTWTPIPGSGIRMSGRSAVWSLRCFSDAVVFWTDSASAKGSCRAAEVSWTPGADHWCYSNSHGNDTE